VSWYVVFEATFHHDDIVQSYVRCSLFQKNHFSLVGFEQFPMKMWLLDSKWKGGCPATGADIDSLPHFWKPSRGVQRFDEVSRNAFLYGFEAHERHHTVPLVEKPVEFGQRPPLFRRNGHLVAFL
jgi:hypothetical protein